MRPVGGSSRCLWPERAGRLVQEPPNTGRGCRASPCPLIHQVLLVDSILLPKT